MFFLRDYLAALREWFRGEAARPTLGYFALFACMGLNSAVTGPTLPALAAQTHARVGQMGWLFFAGSLGTTLGTAMGGRVFGAVRGHPVLGFAQIFSGTMLVLVPLSPSLMILTGVLAAKGMADGFVNTGGNTLLVWTHGEKTGPYMNGMHCCFGFGAFLAPLLVAQVIGTPGGYRWAYWALAAISVAAGLRMLMLKREPAPQIEAESKKSGIARIYYPLIISTALYLFFYVGAELAFAGWLFTYAVTLKLMTAAAAAYLTSGFWFCFTLGRLAAVAAAARFTPNRIILSNLFACLALLLLAILTPRCSLALGVVALGLGFCLAPLWPTGYTLAGQSLNLTAWVSGLILLGDSFGGMILPWLTGEVIQATGPRTMLFLVFGSLICVLLAFAAMLRFRQGAPGAAL